MNIQMTERQKNLTALVILLLLVAAMVWLVVAKPITGSLAPKNQPAKNTQKPPPAQPTSVAYAVTPVVESLRVPWSIVFPSKDRWLVSERSGALRIVEAGKLVATPLTTFNVSDQGEEGLMGLALDPNYRTNKLVYACYAHTAGSGLADRVVRFEDRGTTAGPQTILIDNIPAATNHAGCRLSFGPADKKLYITTGDATNKAIAQNLSSLGGKILRINPDGSVPSDNPFAQSPVWTLGHRNPQGLAWQPGTNQLFATEHGPSGFDGPGGGDEVNIIKKGANYGYSQREGNELLQADNTTARLPDVDKIAVQIGDEVTDTTV
ncbi:MAG TPA: PQQ-dependent sugar dehydrogenase, partial [Candidatus Polarisedimenticolaceae bacterium]|nr:PQQ-dependent sugar dehydrogenase [Candidatus Polarisedimenticolaceae bacterium]